MSASARTGRDWTWGSGGFGRWREIKKRKGKKRLSSHLETLDGREQRQREGQRGSGAELPQLVARDAAPVDGPGVAHLQHQVHGPLAGQMKMREHRTRLMKLSREGGWEGGAAFAHLQLVILQTIWNGSSRLTVSGITSRDSLMSP